MRFPRHGLFKTKFCGIFRVSRANAHQITDGLLDSLRTRFTRQFEGNATSSTDEPRVGESEEPLEASDSGAAGSDDWGSADENPLDKSDDEQRESACIDSVPAATAEKPEGDKQGTHPILIGMASDGASVLSGKKGGHSSNSYERSQLSHGQDKTKQYLFAFPFSSYYSNKKINKKNYISLLVGMFKL